MQSILESGYKRGTDVEGVGELNYLRNCDDPVISLKTSSLIRALYAFVHNPDLTNPEVTFFTGQDDTGDAQKLSFSRDAENDDKKLPDEKRWQELASLTDLDGIMCVAGTNKADTRRVVVLYVPRAEFEKSVIISFPNTVNGRLNSREVRVLRFFDALPESISQFSGKN